MKKPRASFIFFLLIGAILFGCFWVFSYLNSYKSIKIGTPYAEVNKRFPGELEKNRTAYLYEENPAKVLESGDEYVARMFEHYYAYDIEKSGVSVRFYFNTNQCFTGYRESESEKETFLRKYWKKLMDIFS